MNGSFYVGDELTRIYKKGKGYLTLVQKVTPTSYITMHTIFENTFDFKNYPSIEEMLSDTVSLAFRFQNTKNVYRAFIEEEQFLDGKLKYEIKYAEYGENIYEALALLEEKIKLERGIGR